MSSDRPNATARPLKPTLASTRAPRTPLTPRLATATTSTPTGGSLRRPPTVRAAASSASLQARPQVKQDVTPLRGTTESDNITPRSSKRKSRVEGASTPPPGESPSVSRSRSSITNATDKNGPGSIGSMKGMAMRPRTSRPKSLSSDTGLSPGFGRTQSPLVRSPGIAEVVYCGAQESIDSRFFRASEAKEQKPIQKVIEKKTSTPAFFYADGQKEEKRPGLKSSATSPVLSAVEKRPSVPWARTDTADNALRSPPMLSPTLSAISAASSFFPPMVQTLKRSPSPAKENIHLSYRKGVSQIFGARPSPIPSPRTSDESQFSTQRRGSLEPRPFQTPHKKSPSLSSIDSGNSHKSRRRSATNLADGATAPSPLSLEAKSATFPKISRAPVASSRLESCPEAPLPRPARDGALSPTRPEPDYAAEARRERKVLDLEISNSSLLAINASLERELRRQKAELKRYRRLTRAGRIGSASYERAARLSEGLSTLGEEDADNKDFDDIGLPSDLLDEYDESSDDDDSASLTSSAAETRLAKDEKRLRDDLAKHKDLLVQSQMMNQSLKRCMYTTEQMIADGKKALAHHVRISDVQLGGRILTGSESDDEIDVTIRTFDADAEAGAEDETQGFLDVWQGLGGKGRTSIESSDGGDRDSGIEVDKPIQSHSLVSSIPHADLDRPPEEATEGYGSGIARGRPRIQWGSAT